MAVLLLTRPAGRSCRLIDALAERGLTPAVIVSPVMEIRSREVSLPPGAELILTSQNAVAALPQGRWRAWCVGDRTAEAASAAGLEAVSASGDVEALLRLLVAERPEGLIHVRGVHSTGDLAARLLSAGLAASEVIAYEQVPVPLSAAAAAALAGDEPLVVPLYSPRSAALLAAHHGPWRADIHAVAISEAAARAFARPARVTVAATPGGAAMERAVAEALADADGARLVDGDGAG